MSKAEKRLVSRREVLRCMGGIAAGTALSPLLVHSKMNNSRPPNILFLVADDLGYGDVGCYGSTICDTPNLDKLAEEGARLTGFYVATPLCAPTRVSFITGKYPQRTSLAWNPNYKNEEDGLSPDEITIAKVLKEAGYRTGLVGKWHLGYAPKFRPRCMGFEEFYGFLSGWMDYYKHTYNDDTKWMFRNDEPIEEEGYATELFTREAIAYIDRHKEEPFFLYVAYSAPHWPAQAPQRWIGKSRHGVYGAQVLSMDDSIGRIIRHLDALGLRDNTLVVFISDNGGDGSGSNAPLSGGKGNLLEGGIRTVCIARWPSRIPAGSVVSTPIISMDLFATFAAVGHAKITPGIDGKNALSVLEGKRKTLHETLLWQFGKQTAARRGNLKLLREEGKPHKLFDVVNDPAETKDISAAHPALVQELSKTLDEWVASLKNRA